MKKEEEEEERPFLLVCACSLNLFQHLSMALALIFGRGYLHYISFGTPEEFRHP